MTIKINIAIKNYFIIFIRVELNNKTHIYNGKNK